MKTKKFKGIEYKLVKVQGFKNWYWQIGSQNVNDWYETQSQANKGAKEYINYIKQNENPS